MGLRSKTASCSTTAHAKDTSVTAISDLDIFARVARTGNMSVAGREIKLSPAVVSKRISLLEERLGARLFHRTTRQLTLTETGKGYYKRVVDILALFEEAEDYVSRRNTQPRGTLKVTAPTAVTRCHIAPNLSGFLDVNKGVEVDLYVTDSFVDLIRDGFDLAIRVGELEDSSLVARKIGQEARILVASPSYVAENGAPRSVADLQNHNCLLAGAQDFWRIEGPDGRTDVRVNGSIRSNSADLVRQAILDGLGIGLCATWDIADDLMAEKLVRILPEHKGVSSNGIYAVYPSREFMPAKVHAFIEFFEPIIDRETTDAARSASLSDLAPAPASAKGSQKTAASKSASAGAVAGDAKKARTPATKARRTPVAE